MSSSIDESKIDGQHHEFVKINMTKEEKQYADAIDSTAAQLHVNTTPSFASKIQPVPIGFGAFALCSFVLGLYNTGLITNMPQVAVGVAFGYGAMGQFICGVCELILGNVFAATSMLTFSGFFFTFGIMMIPSSGILEMIMATGGMEAVHECMGLIQIGYAIAAFLFLLGTLRQPILIRMVLLQVFLAFLCGGIGGLTGINNFNLASGWISFTLALTAWYIMAAILYTPEHTMIKLPLF
ncbi:GPR1/FUN34/yaaH family-domain-containing protein [Mycotypha africana]|uniref:GPR1/FUN34/yaaH family-domain-containing protein n=1 Tax=Mycotypha africana TaxID=64632 RepID=UPI002300D2D2|nr:GPR1/FUN34/yaaH family-domain-containing protein [Mycotypha africana]KAI8977389.1 GPR1/FUN34/yaaH family-domain-containing protein [Mycotypha africana]